MAQSVGFWEPFAPTLIRLFRSVTGPSRVILDREVENHVASLTVHSLHGYDITINCQATYYKRLFQRKYMFARKMAVYEISTIVPPDAPPRLQDTARDFVVTIPRECLYWRGESYQKQRAIEAYLDLLLAKLDRRGG
jgi:hypothetical protein